MRYIVAPAKTLRKEGLLSILGHEKRLWIFTLVASLVPELLHLIRITFSIESVPIFYNGNFFSSSTYLLGELPISDYISDAYYVDLLGRILIFSSIMMSIIYMLIKGPLYLSNVKAILNTARKNDEKIGYGYGFKYMAKAFGLLLMQQVFIFLWGILLVIPGIIASIRYSMAFYILADNPDKSIRQCMDESKMMMKGNLGKYFCVSISFIGWYILIAIINSIAMFIIDIILGLMVGGIYHINTASYNTIVILVEYAGYVFVSMLILYREATFIGMYRKLIGENNSGVLSEETIAKYEVNMEQKGSYDMEELQRMEEAKLSEEKDEQPNKDE